MSSQASEPNVENAAGMLMARALVQALAAENVQRAKAKRKAIAKPKARTNPEVTRNSKSKKKNMQSLKRSQDSTRIPTSSEPTDSSAEESSPETKRIQAAAHVAKKPAKSVAPARIPSGSDDGEGDSLSSDSSAAAGRDAQFAVELPLSSGVFDYMSWAVQHVLTAAEKDSLRPKAATTIAIGSMCAGMATEDIALRGIANAMLQHENLNLHITHAFKAEADKDKMIFLRRHSRESGTHFFDDNAALKDSFPHTVDGKQVERPKCTVLLCGIVCKCISGLNTAKPKSERGDGSSGKALSGLLASLTAMPLEERPKLIVLECVARLGQKRSVDPDSRRGTDFITDELLKLGYVGEWRRVTPTSFYLPQGRPRVYAMFLKRTDFSNHTLNARQQDVKRGFAIILRMQLGQHEPLPRVLSRCSLPPPTCQRLTKTSCSRATKWPRQHQDYAEQKGILVADRLPSQEFQHAVGNVLPDRALHAFWLRLAHAKHRGLNWQTGTWVATVGASPRFMSLRTDIFPCVTPKMTFGILRNGNFAVADGFTLLAMQGVQHKEVEAFFLDREDPALLHDFAGNGFTANIVAAFLLAGFLVM